jgi:hypothetical protein
MTHERWRKYTAMDAALSIVTDGRAPYRTRPEPPLLPGDGLPHIATRQYDDGSVKVELANGSIVTITVDQ